MLTNIKRVFKEAFQNIVSEKSFLLSTIVTMTVIFLMLEFFGAYAINMRKLNDYLKTNIQIKAYLKDGTTEEGKQKLQADIMAIPEVKGVKFYSKEIALNDMSKSLNINLDIKDNPLPDTVFITVDENTNMEGVRTQIETIDIIDQVEGKSEIVEKISKFVKGLNRAVLYFSIGASIPVFILIYNFVNAGILLRKTDIEIMSLVGASRWYIRMPFIIEGFINIFISAGISIGLFYFIYSYIADGIKMVIPVMPFATTMEVVPTVAVLVFGYGAIITTIASYISIKKYVRIHGD
jgi:cell division transport system permease protein